MIQVYKKNNLFIIEDTVRDMIYPNLTKREAKELLKFFSRDTDRVKYAITDFENFKYVNLAEKEKLEYTDTIKFVETSTPERVAEVLDEQSKQIEELQEDVENLTNSCNWYFDENKKLKQQLAEKDKEFNWLHNKFAKFVEQHNQDKISFAVDILEELADCSNYINSKLDFECGSYVPENVIRDKIKYLKGKKDE